jgi:hypothetical protein
MKASVFIGERQLIIPVQATEADPEPDVTAIEYGRK